MEHGARLSTTRVIGLGFICLGTVTVLSLATNVIQGINIRYGKGHESDRGRWWPCGFQR